MTDTPVRAKLSANLTSWGRPRITNMAPDLPAPSLPPNAFDDSGWVPGRTSDPLLRPLFEQVAGKAPAEQTKKAGKPSGGDDPSGAAPTRCTKTWAMLIKRVYEVDPLSCPRCGSAGGRGGVHRPATGRRDREDSASLRPLARVRTETATGHGGFGPRPGWLLLAQRDGRTDVRGHGHVPSHLLIHTDACRHEEGACRGNVPPVVCRPIGRNSPPYQTTRAASKEATGRHGGP